MTKALHPLLILLLILASGLTLEAQPPRKTIPPKPAKPTGMQIFITQKCGNCHKLKNYGTLTGPDLTFIGKRMTTLQIQAKIIDGSPTMPAYGSTLKKEEINTLVRFLAAQK